MKTSSLIVLALVAHQIVAMAQRLPAGVSHPQTLSVMASASSLQDSDFESGQTDHELCRASFHRIHDPWAMASKLLAVNLDSVQSVGFIAEGDTTERTSLTYRLWERNLDSYDYDLFERQYQQGRVVRVHGHGRAHLTLPDDVTFDAYRTFDPGTRTLFTYAKVFTKPINLTTKRSTTYTYEANGVPGRISRRGIFSVSVGDTIEASSYRLADTLSVEPLQLTGVTRSFRGGVRNREILMEESIFPNYNGVRTARSRIYRTTVRNNRGQLSSIEEQYFTDTDNADLSLTKYTYTHTPSRTTILRIQDSRRNGKSEAFFAIDSILADNTLIVSEYKGQAATPASLVSVEQSKYVEGLLLRREIAYYEDQPAPQFVTVDRYYYSGLSISGVQEDNVASKPCAEFLATSGLSFSGTSLSADHYTLFDMAGRRVAEQRVSLGEQLQLRAPAAGIYSVIGAESGCMSRVAAVE